MQRLQLDPEEKITRKEYLKRKKKQAGKLKDINKKTYIIAALFILLSVYICIQFYVYSKSQAFKYVEGDNVNAQKVYNVYYVTEGYTYDPVYSLNSINSNGFNDKVVYQNSGIINVSVDDNYIYGIKNKELCRINKTTNEVEMLVEKDVNKYSIYKNRIYYISGENNTLKYIDLETKQIINLRLDNISEILIDDNNIFVVKDKKTKKILIRYNKEAKEEKILTDEDNVSYIIQDISTIYFVNKKDNNKIYSIKKDGSNLTKVADIKTNADSGTIKEVDGAKYMFIDDNELYYINSGDSSTLCKVDLSTKKTEKVLSVPVELLQIVDGTVFYKVKDEMGVYLYNYKTKFMSQVTKRKIKEFSVDPKAISNVDVNGNLDRN